MKTDYNISKGRLIVALIALFLSSMCTVGDTVVTPIIGTFYNIFAGEPEALINLGITGPAFVGLPFCLLGGILCDRFEKKVVMVVGFVIFTVSAVFGASMVNIYYFVIMRCLATGVGWGLTNTAAMAIIASLFTDENTHGKVVGWYIAAMGILGALLSVVSGFLAVSSWKHSYLTYIIAIPVLVLLAIFLPSMPPVKSVKKVKTDEMDDKRWWLRLIPLNIQIFLIGVCAFCFYLYVSFVCGRFWYRK